MEEEREKGIQSLKRMEHPYLHDLFKTVLLYDAGEVKHKLERRFSRRKILKWNLYRSYTEFLSRYPRYWSDKTENQSKADIIWLIWNTFEDSNRFEWSLIIHEVKTGKHNLDEIVQNYKKSYFKLQDCKFGRIKTKMPLFVWCWPKYNNNYSNELTKKLLQRGAVQICDLNWLLDILYKRLEEVFEVDGRNKRRGL